MRLNNFSRIENLLEVYYLQLFHFAERLSGSPTRAMLLTQCTFKLAAERTRNLPMPAQVRPWLYSLLFKLFLENRLRLQRA
jgi:DNA-directed RNA polymerase specialized sigma24 family protein